MESKKKSKEELISILRSIKVEDLNELEGSTMDGPELFAFYESAEEREREEYFYRLLSKEERERWTNIRLLFITLDEVRRLIFIDIEKAEIQYINSYIKNANLVDNEIYKYLRQSELKYIQKITKCSYGRELFDRFTIEKYLYLFSEIDDYKPTDIQEVSWLLREDEDKMKLRLIKYIAKLKAVTKILSTIDQPIPENPHLKDFTKTPKHYDVIMNTLRELGIIDSATYHWLPSNEYSKKFAGSFINSLAFAGYLKTTPNYSQVKLIAQNTFDLELGDVNAKSKHFNTPEHKFVREKIEKLLKNDRLNSLNLISSILPDW